MCNGAGAEAGLVGEDAAGDALLHTEKDAADGTARKGCGVKRPHHDGLQHRREPPDVQDDHAQCQHHIEQGHKRHQLLRDAADPLDAAQQHHGHQHGHQHAHDQVERRQNALQLPGIGQHRRVDGRDDGVDLRGVAGAEHGQHAEQGVEHRQPLPLGAKAVLHIIHGAAHQLPVLIPLPEMHRQRDFGHLGTHSQQSRAPHPEHSPRTADGNGTRHARDVARADRCRQCGADGLKRRHGTIRGILFAEDASDGRLDGVGEFPDLQKAGPHAEQQPHADDADHGRNAPDKLIDGIVDRRNRLDHVFFLTL